MTFLGIDLGTSAVKVLLTDSRSAARDRLGRAVDQPPASALVGTGPQAWWHAMLDAIAAVRAAHPAGFAAARHRALGADARRDADRSRGPGAAPRDPGNDTRAGTECVELEALVPESRAITGNMAMPASPRRSCCGSRNTGVPRGAQAAAEGLPDLAPVRRIRVRDVRRVGHAGLDCARRDWSDRMLAATELTRAQMPRLVEGNAPAAQLRDTLRREWGIAGPVTIAGGAGDNAASAIGMGVTGAGSASCRSARRACCSPATTASRRTRMRPCTRSATASKGAGTR